MAKLDEIQNLDNFSFLTLKSYQGLIRRGVSVPNVNSIVFVTFPVLHFFFRFFLEKNFIECVSSAYVDITTLEGLNLAKLDEIQNLDNFSI